LTGFVPDSPVFFHCADFSATSVLNVHEEEEEPTKNNKIKKEGSGIAGDRA